MKQFESFNSVLSVEQEKRQKQSEQSSDKVSMVMKTEKHVKVRKDISHLNDQLEKQMELLLKPDFKEEFSLEQNNLDAALGRHLAESEKWQKQS